MMLKRAINKLVLIARRGGSVVSASRVQALAGASTLCSQAKHRSDGDFCSPNFGWGRFYLPYIGNLSLSTGYSFI